MTDEDKALVERCKGHTKGPWRVVYYDCGDCDYYDHNGPCPSIQAPDSEDCAIVHWDGFKQEYWSSANGDQRQIKANANLIAAAPELLDRIEAQATEIEKLKSIVRGWHYLAVGPDEMGDYYTQKQLIKASAPYASPALAALEARND